MLELLNTLVDRGCVSTTKLNTVRVKVNTVCQWACFFCHMEGNKESSPLNDVQKLLEVLSSFRDTLHFSEVHLTGGEPSIHKHIAEIVRSVVDAGFVVKMTTNGQGALACYKECIDAGLSELNVSIHTLNPLHLGNMMYPARGAVWGSRALVAQMKFLDDLHKLIKIKVNTCVDADETDALSVLELAKRYELKWRAMNVLENPEASYAALARMCTALRANPVEAMLIDGSSSCSVQMHCGDGYDFKVKLIRSNFLQHMCGNCEIDRKGHCYEHFYGPRIEVHNEKLMVRSCIYRNGEPFVQVADKYLSSPVLKDLKNTVS